MVHLAEFFERLGGALLVLFAAFVMVPIVLAIAFSSQLDAVGQLFIVLACALIFIGAIMYIIREKQYS